MATKSRYNLMADSSQTDAYGNYYPDLATFCMDKFTYVNHPVTHDLTYKDTQRFFDLIYSYYSNFSFYDDFTLWINGISMIVDSDTNVGVSITLYDSYDINKFYSKNLQ